ncbi:MAG: hypothetical protein NC319_00690 [Butyricicoccus sp.]|nr:hypothetical protein [Butyricicoccus sp.]
MNIGQIARNQQMLYKIANKNVSSGYSANPAASSSKISAYSALLNGWGTSSSAKDNENNFFSSPAALQGTPRQIAKRLYDASFSSDAAADKNTANITQGSYSAGEDQTLKALQEQLRAKAEALQQAYQPDKTVSGSFEQLQSIAEGLVSRLQTVTLSDETTKKIQELALSDAKNSAGAQEGGETDAAASALSKKDRLDMIQGEVQRFAPSRRAAALNTINKVWESELDRIGEHIKGRDPNWTMWGDKFDVSILDDYKAGINMWV